jgi:hypothetical protein
VLGRVCSLLVGKVGEWNELEDLGVYGRIISE